MPAKNQSAEFSFISLNTMGAPLKPKRKERYEKMFELLSTCPANVYALQETFHPKHSRTLLDPFENMGVEIVEGGHRDFWKLKTTGSGLTTISYNPVIKQEFYPFAMGRSIDRYANKGVLLTRVVTEAGKEIDLYNTHMQSSYFYRDQNAHVRLRQLEEMADFVRSHSSQNSTIILTGDFNFKETTKEYDFFTNKLWGGSGYDFSEIMRSLKPDLDDPLHTYQKRSNKNLLEKIDHKFMHVGQGWTWNQSQSHSEILNEWDVSDHRPILTKLVFEAY